MENSFPDLRLSKVFCHTGFVGEMKIMSLDKEIECNHIILQGITIAWIIFRKETCRHKVHLSTQKELSLLWSIKDQSTGATVANLPRRHPSEMLFFREGKTSIMAQPEHRRYIYTLSLLTSAVQWWPGQRFARKYQFTGNYRFYHSANPSCSAWLWVSPQKWLAFFRTCSYKQEIMVNKM